MMKPAATSPSNGPAMAHAPPADRSRSLSTSRAPLLERGRFAAPLSTPLTSFVGRVQEVEAVAALLREEEVRLVTLTGPGGVGKTRIALRVADALAVAYPDGVFFVSLASLTDPAQVVPTVAQVLDVQEMGDWPLPEQLANALRNREMLLVLDNFEHVVAAAPAIMVLLARCPGVRALVTSRSVLRVSGEHAVAEQPLALPRVGRAASADAIAESDAERLFAERARATRSDFAPTGVDAAVVAEIVCRLDGLPLAIELAAARVAHLPLVALLARLERRLPLLARGARDLPTRHQAMRHAIAWSHDLLSSDEKALFRRLAVFAGGWTLEAAEAVVADASDLGMDILEGMASLVDNSLLRQEGRPDGEPRYRMLETIREFAIERLAASGEGESTRAAHAHHFAAFAETKTFHHFFDPPVGRLDRMEAEHDNLRAALAWALERGQTEVTLRLAVALWPFWYLRGHVTEGRMWLERAVGLDGIAPAALRAEALIGASWLAGEQEDWVAAGDLAQEGLRFFQDLGDAEGIAHARHALAVAIWEQGDFGRAAQTFEEALAGARSLGDPGLVAITLNSLADGFLQQGERNRAEPIFEEALALMRNLGNPLAMLYPLSNLGVIALEQGEVTRAASLLRESLALAVTHGNTRVVACDLVDLAGVAEVLGQGERAVRLLGAAEALLETIGVSRPDSDRPYYDRLVSRVRSGVDEDTFGGAWAAGRTLTRDDAVAEANAIAAEATEAFPASRPPNAGARYGLSVREVDVLRLIAEGMTDREIGETLFISRRTVTTHVTSILNKLGVETRRGARALALKHGLF